MRKDQGQGKEGGHPGAHIQAHPVSARFASLPFTGTASSHELGVGRAYWRHLLAGLAHFWVMILACKNISSFFITIIVFVLVNCDHNLLKAQR